MSAIRYILREFRLPPALALVVLSALVLSQIAAVAHADIDCDHETCGLCIASASDGTLIDTTAPKAIPPCKHSFESPSLLITELATAPTIRFIRGPPAN